MSKTKINQIDTVGATNNSKKNYSVESDLIEPEEKGIKAPKIKVVKEETIEEMPEEKPKKKRVVNEKTLEALAKGREKLKNNWEEGKKRREELNEKYAIKKANKLIKEKMNIKKSLGVQDLDSEEEEPIKIVQPKKPKKKQMIILDPESESEEEIVYKKPIKQQPKQEIKPVIEQKQNPRIIFF
jgi:hypothetical protein